MPNPKETISLSNYLLSEIEAAINDNSYESEWYLDTEEEETIFLCDPAITGMYEENERLQQKIEEDEVGRFILIPSRPSREAWRQMERFIYSLDDVDDNTRDLLLNTIQGKGAFRRFKDAMYDIGMQDRWFEFKNREDRKEALHWLRSEELITDKQVEKGMQLYEERLHQKQRREMEIANMNQGKLVKCRNNSGHTQQLTVGKKYEVLDEQKEHLNIRIKDDRGKICWLPKSHFKLVNF